MLFCLAGVALLLGIAFWYVNTESFADHVRAKLIDVLATATGGRVELARFSWHPLQLEAEVDGLTIHGLEAPDQVPYLHVDTLRVQAKIIDAFKAQIGLRSLDVEHPVFHLIVYPDGSTNQPVPKKQTESNKPVTDTIFDLEANRAQVNNGVLLLNQRALPFNVAANHLATTVTYRAQPESYLGTVHVEDLTAQRDKAPAVHSTLDLNVEMARNALKLDGLHFVTGESKLDVSGALNDFTKLNWKIGANGAIDLREVAALAAVEGLERGVTGVQIQGQGSGVKAFDVTGNVQLKDGTYRESYLLLSGISATSSLHATQDEVTLPNVRVRLRQGGGVDANAKLVNYMAPAPPAQPAVAMQSSRKTPGTTAPKSGPQQEASIRARIFGIRPEMIFEIIAEPKYANLGFDTQADGTAEVRWKGSINDLVASANVTVAPPRPPTPNEIPVTGVVDAGFALRGGRLDARHIEMHTPASNLNVTGRAAFIPMTGASALNVDFTTDNLNEFDRALIVFGVKANGKKGVAALPVQLHGQAGFEGTVTGSLLNPDVKGHASAKEFATVIETAAATHPPPQPTTPVSAEPPHPPPPSQGTRQTVQWDDLELDAEYSPALISVSNLSLTRGKTSIHGSAQLHAVHGRRGKLLYNNSSMLNADAHITDASVTDLLSIAGESLPVTGTLNLQAHAGGALNALTGGGHLSVAAGQIYGEDYKSLTTDLKFAGESAGVTNLVFVQDGGRITGDGDYNIQAKSFRGDAQGTGFDLSHIRRLQSAKQQLGGALSFDLHASGSTTAPQVNGKLALANLTLNGQAAGSVNANVQTTGHTLHLNANATLAQAQFQMAGQMQLTDNYPVDAKLTFSQLDFAPVLALLDVSGVKGNSQLAGLIHITGPAKTPKQLDGTAEIDQFKVALERLPLTSKGPIRASLTDGVVKLDQLEIDAEDTTLSAGGTADLLGDGGMDVQAHGAINAKLAQSFSTELTSTGHIDFNLTAQGALKKPDLEGTFNFKDVNLAYQQIPNGISHLNGSMVFNQDRLELRNIQGTTGGGTVTLGGFLIYQQGVYGDVSVTLKNTRFRYAGLSSSADAKLRLQGTQNSMVLSGNIQITRFLVGPNMDFAALTGGAGAVSPPPDPNAFGNKVRLDVHITSSPQMDFQNSFAQIAGSVNLRIRGTVAQPAVLGRINITDGKATYNGTTYELRHGDIYFTNPVKIEPVIDMDVTTRIEEYDVTIGLHGTASKLTPTFRSEPPLPEADVFSLLAQGRTQEEQSIYSTQQSAAGVNGTANAVLSGALNATVSNRIQKLFGVGSVKIDPTYTGSLGQSSARITVTQNIGQQVLLTYATSVNSTTQQLIQAQVNLTPIFSVTAVRDEADVFSLVFKVHKRYR
ncbi:MAG TPA: translocation/assembly module TamB domain-containing protein [Acidobacteriaceae bacterium]